VAGFIGMLSTAGFVWLHFKAGKKLERMANGVIKNVYPGDAVKNFEAEPGKAGIL